MTAAEKILQKALVTSGLDSSQWNRVQAGLRDRAFFSSQVASARILHALREQVAAATEGVKSDSEIRRDIREYLSKAGYNPSDARGTIKDLYTKARLDVIIDTNRRQARGFAQHMEATTKGALRSSPAYELVRVYERNQKRNWIQRWTAAGGKVYPGNRMIALKTDPIWTRISAFGTPYPPFDWGSGMGVEDVGRGECLDLGVIDEDTPDQTPPTADFNSGMQAEVPFENDDQWQFLKRSFGDQVQIDEKTRTVKWRGELFRENFDKGGDFTIRLGEASGELANKVNEAMPGLEQDVIGKALVVSQKWLNKKRKDGIDHRDHFTTMLEHPEDIPLETRDIDLLPSMWRHPDRVFESHGRLVLEIDAMDGSIYRAIVDIKKNPTLKTFYRTLEPYKKQTPSS